MGMIQFVSRVDVGVGRYKEFGYFNMPFTGRVEQGGELSNGTGNQSNVSE
jgi:hypothetical protein